MCLCLLPYCFMNFENMLFDFIDNHNWSVFCTILFVIVKYISSLFNMFCLNSSEQIEGGKVKAVTDFPFLGSKITVNCDCSHEMKRHLLLERKAMTNLDSILKIETSLCWKDLHSQSYGFSSSHVWMWDLDHKEGWGLKNWCFWIVVMEDSWESPAQ